MVSENFGKRLTGMKNRTRSMGPPTKEDIEFAIKYDLESWILMAILPFRIEKFI